MRELSILVIIIGFSAGSLLSQDLLSGADMYSHKKTAYITKSDGTELKGTIKKIKRKKGLLMSVSLETEAGPMILMPEEIDHMYLPPSGLDKLNRTVDEAYTMSKWDREDVASDRIKEGYVYFERAKVDLKGKERVLLMQLLNPGFSNRIKVFFDPFAQETSRVGVGGFTVSGGLDKSYYLQKGDEPAYRMKKENIGKTLKISIETAQAYTMSMGKNLIGRILPSMFITTQKIVNN